MEKGIGLSPPLFPIRSGPSLPAQVLGPNTLHSYGLSIVVSKKKKRTRPHQRSGSQSGLFGNLLQLFCDFCDNDRSVGGRGGREGVRPL